VSGVDPENVRLGEQSPLVATRERPVEQALGLQPGESAPDAPEVFWEEIDDHLYEGRGAVHCSHCGIHIAEALFKPCGSR
jgi:hypothetical protein